MEITFKKTGNFWLDAAIVGLYNKLREVNEDAANLGVGGLMVVMPTETDILALLNTAQKAAGDSYLTRTKKFGWYFKDDVFTPYQRTDFRLHLKSFFTGKTGRPIDGVLHESGDGSNGKNRSMTFKEKAAFTKAVNDYKEKKPTGKIYLDGPPVYEFGEPYETNLGKRGKHVCMLSGERTKKVIDITGMHYPFVTGKSGEINFTSHLQAPTRLSGKLAFLSLFAFRNLFYTAGQDNFHYFLVSDSNLQELATFQFSIQGILAREGDTTWGNFTPSIVGTVFTSEALLNFLLSMFRQIRERQLSDLRKQAITKKIYTFTSDGKVFHDVREYSSLAKLFAVFEVLDYIKLTLLLQQFQERLESGKYKTTWRNELSRAVLNFTGINFIVEEFLASVCLKDGRKNLPHLYQLISDYNHKIAPKMDEQLIKKCSHIGWTLGSYAKDSNNRSIMYAIRNAGTRADFLAALNNAQFRIESHKREHKNSDTAQKLYDLSHFNDEMAKAFYEYREWTELRSLISIFSMNTYLNNPKTKDNGE